MGFKKKDFEYREEKEISRILLKDSSRLMVVQQAQSKNNPLWKIWREEVRRSFLRNVSKKNNAPRGQKNPQELICTSILAETYSLREGFSNE
jgi:hypothetical protein